MVVIEKQKVKKKEVFRKVPRKPLMRFGRSSTALI